MPDNRGFCALRMIGCTYLLVGVAPRAMPALPKEHAACEFLAAHTLVR